MQPVLVHHCRSCSYNTPIPFSASVFSQDNYCAHCSALAIGVNVRPGESAYQKPDMQQDELAQLFNKSLNLANFSPEQQPVIPIATPPTPPQDPQQEPKPGHNDPSSLPSNPTPPIAYASTHYIQPTNFAQKQAQQQAEEQARLQQEQEQTQQQQSSFRTEITPQQLEEVLINHGIDPSSLFPSQIQLIQNGDDAQRLRLLELWRISPPQYHRHVLDELDGMYPQTSLQQEEQLARIRFERKQQQEEEILKEQEARERQRQLEMQLKYPEQYMQTDVLTNMLQPPRATSAPASTSSPEAAHAEPYVLSGYEQLAQREYERQAELEDSLRRNSALQESSRYNQATDPAYEKKVGGIWEMENQYGAFEQMRETEVFCMGQAIVPCGVDEEMIM